jgi:hypothetical protein
MMEVSGYRFQVSGWEEVSIVPVVTGVSIVNELRGA